MQKSYNFFSSKVSILKFCTVRLQCTDIVFGFPICYVLFNFARSMVYLRLNVRDFEQIQKNWVVIF